MHRMHQKALIIILCVAVLLQSCGKKIVPVVPQPPKTLAIEEIDFEYFHGKARLNYKDDKKEKEVKANIRIRKDSVIWMTLSVIGVQGGKALINKDSITIVSTVDKEYYVFEYAELTKRFNFKIDYNVVQAAVLGNLIMPRDSTDKILSVNNFDVLDQKQGTVYVKNYINPLTKKLEKVELSEATSTNSLSINYSNFQPVSDKTFPYNGIISVFYKTIAGIFNTTITLEYNKAEVGDKELKFPFNIPKRYQRR